MATSYAFSGGEIDGDRRSAWEKRNSSQYRVDTTRRAVGTGSRRPSTNTLASPAGEARTTHNPASSASARRSHEGRYLISTMPAPYPHISRTPRNAGLHVDADTKPTIRSTLGGG